MKVSTESGVKAAMNHTAVIQESLRYIDEHLEDNIRLDDLAGRAHLSKYHYHRLFHRAVGDSVNRYIGKRRMEKAADELARTDAPILDIALGCRYSSQESFSRAFQKVYEMTPGRYRKTFAAHGQSGVVRLRAGFGKQRMDMAA